MLGIPRSTLVGQPPRMLQGSIEDLRVPDAIIVEETSMAMLGNPQVGAAKLGDELKINDRRALIVGVCEARKGFESNAIIYTTFENAIRYAPQGRERISYVLVKAKAGQALSDVQQRIDALGDATGIGINFGITILLGVVVGLLLSASIFYQFTIENLRSFAVLKAMGATTRTLLGMIMLQAVVVGVVGFGIGSGAAGIFAIIARVSKSELQVLFPWQLLVGTFLATILTIVLGSVLSVRRVLSVSPGTVFSS